MEIYSIIIIILIVIAFGFALYKTIKNKGKCACGDCSKCGKCPYANKGENNE